MDDEKRVDLTTCLTDVINTVTNVRQKIILRREFNEEMQSKIKEAIEQLKHTID